MGPAPSPSPRPTPLEHPQHGAARQNQHPGKPAPRGHLSRGKLRHTEPPSSRPGGAGSGAPAPALTLPFGGRPAPAGSGWERRLSRASLRFVLPRLQRARPTRDILLILCSPDNFRSGFGARRCPPARLVLLPPPPASHIAEPLPRGPPGALRSHLPQTRLLQPRCSIPHRRFEPLCSVPGDFRPRLFAQSGGQQPEPRELQPPCLGLFL